MHHSPGHVASADSAPATLSIGTSDVLYHAIAALVGEQNVRARAIDLIRYATDASPYRMIPKVVVTPRDTEDVAKLFSFARENRVPITFRAAGTSLGGQSQGDGILMDVRKHWSGCVVERGGRRIRARPGTVLSHANHALEPFGFHVGPDPASGTACTIGGVVANDAGGVASGVACSAYRTVSAVSFLMPSGTFINTEDPDAEQTFRAAEPALASELMNIRSEFANDAPLASWVRAKFAIKNTTGFHMEAFLDGASPVEIFRRLLIGSEGTLAFLSEIVLETVARKNFRVTSLLVVRDLNAAYAAAAEFQARGAAVIELADRTCLRAIEELHVAPETWRHLPSQATALFVEFRENSSDSLAEVKAGACDLLNRLDLLEPATFEDDPSRVSQIWEVHRLIVAAVAARRPSGTSIMIQSVSFPRATLSGGASATYEVLDRYGYSAAVFGHASVGNLHVVLTCSFDSPTDVLRFDEFLRDLVAVVARFGGSICSERGTGRDIAPFVEREWGPRITRWMRRVKQLADPHNILSPGVLLTDEPRAYLAHLHSVPSAEPEIDSCTDCGLCEPTCPSRNLTMTPRQRIAVRREMLRQPVDSRLTEALIDQFEYDGIDTCVSDGSCALSCPLGIDTGVLMDRFRREGPDMAAMPRSRTRGPSRVSPAERKSAKAIYFHACVARSQTTEKQHGLDAALVALSKRAELPLWMPPELESACCGAIWNGSRAASAKIATNDLVERLWKWSDGGSKPVVCDATSCTAALIYDVVTLLSLTNRQRHSQLRFIDSISWAYEHLLPQLSIRRHVDSVAVHPTCATQRLGLTNQLHALCEALAIRSVTPATATCCAFTGERSLRHPELLKSAMSEEKAELGTQRFDRYICSSRSCEIGLKLGTGHDYRSVIFLLEELTRT